MNALLELFTLFGLLQVTLIKPEGTKKSDQMLGTNPISQKYGEFRDMLIYLFHIYLRWLFAAKEAN